MTDSMNIDNALIEQSDGKQDHANKAQSEDPGVDNLSNYILFEIVVLIVDHDDGLTDIRWPPSNQGF